MIDNETTAESRDGETVSRARTPARAPPTDEVVRWHTGKFVTAAELRDVDRLNWRDRPLGTGYTNSGP